MSSRGPDARGGSSSDPIVVDELADGRRLRVISGDSYASDDGGTHVPLAKADAKKDDADLSRRRDDDDGGAKEGPGESGSRGDVQCPKCGQFFKNGESMFGHLKPSSRQASNALLRDEHGGPFGRIPKKRRSIFKDCGEVSRKSKLVPTTTTKEKGLYIGKHCKEEFTKKQAMAGHIPRHHGKEEKIPDLNKMETSMEHQGMAIQSPNEKQAKGGGETWRGGPAPLSRPMQVEQLSMAPDMGCLSGQEPEGSSKQHYISRNHDTPPLVTPVAADGDRSRPLNIDLNVEPPEEE